MIERVLTLAEQKIDGVMVPVVPGTEYVTEQTDGHFTAHGPQTKPKGGTHPTLLYLWRASPGRYAVCGEAAVIAKLDPTNKGKTMADYSKEPAAADWPCKDKDGSIAVPSVIGPDDPRPYKIHPVVEAEPVEMIP